MTLFVVRTRDRGDAAQRRADLHPKHTAHLEACPADLSIVLAGPVLDADGTAVGSLFVFEAEETHAVRRFCDADPFASAVWDSVEIDPFEWRRGRVMP
ncbi:MAG: YciI family protein [Shimia sp.]